MLIDRGYDIDPAEATLSKGEWDKRYNRGDDRSALHRVFIRPSDGDRILAYFDTPDKADKTFFSVFTGNMRQEDVQHAILVIQSKAISPATKRLFEQFASEGNSIEFFQPAELLFNITHHELVPKHVPLSEEAKAEVLRKYNATDSQLPQILRTDPVIRYLGVGPGTLIEITRNSVNAGEYITYRIVI